MMMVGKETIKERLDSLVDSLRKASEGKLIEGLSMESFSHATFEIIDFEKHIYSPLIYVDKNEDNISVSPVELNDGERQFVLDLRDYCIKNKDFFNDKELYLLRNKAKSGISFFDAGNFYPDFIMWIIDKNKQYIAFIDPKGIRSISGGEENPKIQLYKKIKELQANLGKNNPDIVLNSFIVTPTRLSEICESWRGTITKEDLERCNVLLQKDDKKYIEKLINKALK